MRSAVVERSTKETSLRVELALDQHGPQNFKFGLPFFEHMLHAMAFHGGFALSITGTGDLDVDPHHLVEDIGIVFGQALSQALGTDALSRYGHAVIPMDDALAEATIDLCKRPYLVLQAEWPQERSGNFDMFLLREFFQAFANNGALNLHLTCRYGHNSHHMAEALFKALGRALWQASRPRPQHMGVASTKGLL